MNETTALRVALADALLIMDARQLAELLAEVEKHLAATTEVHDRRGGPEHLARMMDGYKVVQFRVTQELDITCGHETRAEQLRFVCIGCEGFPFDPTVSEACTMCGQLDMVEVDRIEPR